MSRAVTLGLFAALGYLPKIVQDQLFDMLVSRSTAVMTNVPGPTEPLGVRASTSTTCCSTRPRRRALC